VSYKPIENYGVIGDLHTIALVGTDGSVDWCCLPHFDSPSVFAALLDNTLGGYFKISAIAPGAHKQLYLPDTNVLVTRFLSSDGIGEVIDFMPIEACSLRESRRMHTRSSAESWRYPAQCDFDWSVSRRSITRGIPTRFNYTLEEFCLPRARQP
jgi:GH15 family glucan-1,4-alpha-glucosidase